MLGGTKILIITLHLNLFFRKSNFKKIAICLTFPTNYPSSNILVELKSKTLSEKLLYGLQGVAEKEAKQFIGKVWFRNVRLYYYHCFISGKWFSYLFAIMQ